MATRDEAEFVEFVHRSAASLRRMAYLLCGDWHRAQDVVQQAYIRLYVAWPRLRKTEAFNAYARRTVISVIRDEARRPWWKRERTAGHLPEPPGAHPHSAVDTRLVLIHTLQQLPERQRAVLVLRYLEDLTVEQTADVLRIEPGTVKSQASRGIATLRRLLEHAELTAEGASADERNVP